MPSLNTPALTLGSTTNDQRDVTVSGSITFNASDIGKTYRLEIKVYGDDPAGDVLPSDDPVGNDLVYTYQWAGPFLLKPYKSITVAAAGTINYSEKRSVTTSKLDEDKGTKIVGWAENDIPILMPRKDEVYASVTLAGAPVTAKSAVVTTGVGV